MTRPEFTPRTLRPAEPPVPHCPETCVYRIVCPSRTQIGISKLFREGKLTEPRQCVWHDKLTLLLIKEFGDGVQRPTSSGELATLLGQRIERAPLGSDTEPDPWEDRYGL